MHEIICPHCTKAFKVDESGYADILKQVRDSEFTEQLHERLEQAEREKQSAVELAQMKVANEAQKLAAAKDAEIQDLNARFGRWSLQKIPVWQWKAELPYACILVDYGGFWGGKTHVYRFAAATATCTSLSQAWGRAGEAVVCRRRSRQGPRQAADRRPAGHGLMNNGPSGQPARARGAGRPSRGDACWHAQVV